ncbi:MAG: PilN domain-containing protein [Syntrophomonadaceae bacterium]|nr:PilN domain-containing protein [Syntrophomonadaceae bacterium]
MSKPIKINLSTKPRADSKLMITKVLIILLVGLLGTTMGFYYNKALSEFRLQETINQTLKSQHAEYVNLQNNLEKQLELDRKLKDKAKHVEELKQDSAILSKAFSEIEMAVTPKTQLLELEITRDKVLITGLSSDFTEVAKMLAALENSEIFSNTGLISSRETNGNLVIFEIETMWEAQVHEGVD